MLSKLQAGAAATAIGFATTGALATDGLAEFNFNNSSGVESMNGPIAGTLPPKYDGGVCWDIGNHGLINSDLTMWAVGALGMSLLLKHFRLTKLPLPEALGCGALATILAIPLNAYQQPKEVTFQTRVSEVILDEPPNFHRYSFLASDRTYGPFYTQLITIPECSTPLVAIQVGAPFEPDQKINVKFYIDGGNHIYSWVASPAEPANINKNKNLAQK